MKDSCTGGYIIQITSRFVVDSSGLLCHSNMCDRYV